MGKEIERKFLVTGESYKKLADPTLYRQGYLSTDLNATVRVRIAGEKGYLTVKDAGNGIARKEFEYEIPVSDANEMLNELCRKPVIEKYRYKIEYQNMLWEVDEFLGDNQGLVLAEIELEGENQAFVKPDFIGEEVTFDNRYRNSNLAKWPYKQWAGKSC